MAKAPRPEVTTLTGAQLEQLLTEVRPLVPAATYHLIEGLLQTLQWIMAAFEQKTISIARLKRMLFGHSTEKTGKILPADPASDPAAAAAPTAPKPQRKGHGRNGSKDYPGAKRVPTAHPTLKVGQLCPQCLRAKLYLLKTPARLMRIVAQPLFQATLYELERLRCALCGAVFTAPAPPEAGTSKYDPSVGTMLGLMRYGAGQPMYRMDQWQTHFGVPLPASTQWELIEAASATPALVYDALIGIGAQGAEALRRRPSSASSGTQPAGDGHAARLDERAIRTAEGRTQLRTGTGHPLYAQTLGAADAFPGGARRAPG
jgi:hypothetical protein